MGLAGTVKKKKQLVMWYTLGNENGASFILKDIAIVTNTFV